MADDILALVESTVAEFRQQLNDVVEAQNSRLDELRRQITLGVTSHQPPILPDEIMLEILSYIDQTDCARFCQVLKRANRLGRAKLLRHLVVDLLAPLILSPRYGSTPFYQNYTVVRFQRFLELTLRPNSYLQPLLVKLVVFNRVGLPQKFYRMFNEKFTTTEVIVQQDDPLVAQIPHADAYPTRLQVYPDQWPLVDQFGHCLQYLQINCFGVDIPEILARLAHFDHLHTLSLYRVNSLETLVAPGATLRLRLLSVDGVINAIPLEAIDWLNLRHLHFDYTGDDYANALARKLARLQTLLLQDKTVRAFLDDPNVIDGDEERLTEMRKEFYYGLKCGRLLNMLRVHFRLKPYDLTRVYDLLVKFDDCLQVLDIDFGRYLNPRIWVDLTALPSKIHRGVSESDRDQIDDFHAMCSSEGAFPRLRYLMVYGHSYYQLTKTFGYYISSKAIP